MDPYVGLESLHLIEPNLDEISASLRRAATAVARMSAAIKSQDRQGAVREWHDARSAIRKAQDAMDDVERKVEDVG